MGQRLRGVDLENRINDLETLTLKMGQRFGDVNLENGINDLDTLTLKMGPTIRNR
jgi:hypothetical protein